MKVPYTTKSGDKFSIEYFEHTNSWQTKHDEMTVQAESLAKLKEKLEHKTSPKMKARKIPVLTCGRYRNGAIEPAFATSLDGAHYVRVSFAKGTRGRETVNADQVYADTPKNRELVERLAALVKEEAVLNEKQRQLTERLTPFDLKLLKDE